MALLQRLIDALARRDTVERSAALAATIAVGQSFAPSLLARRPGQQAVVTGLNAAMVYSVARTSQSLIESFARRVVPGAGRVAEENRSAFHLLANAAALGVGIAVQRSFRQRRGEPIKRAVVRTAGWQLSATAGLGLTITGTSLLTNAVARRYGKLPVEWIPAGFLLGSVLAAGEIIWYRRLQSERQPFAGALVQGVGVMAGVSVLAVAQRQVAAGVASGIRHAAPGFAGLAEPLGNAATIGPVVAAGWLGLEWVNRRTEMGGAAVEEAYSRPPTSLRVSGGPQSTVAWDTLGREGRRFVNMALPAKEITSITGRPAKDPVRVFVGLDSAASVDARVSRAMDELERLGAFDRSVLCVASPTGTGYINYVVVETLEYLTEGDCATVALQYSLRPSFLSLDRVGLGREQNRVLLHAINGRLRATAEHARPRLVALGESLGAFTLQDAFLHEGTAGLHRSGIERGLFIGTPADSGWAQSWRIDPQGTDPDSEVVEVDGLEEWNRLPEEVRKAARYILLTHHDDPIAKFSPDIAVQAPEWMSPEHRSPAIPPGVPWRPLSSFVLTTVDVLNATDVTPGHFERRGHDYRQDLAEFTRLAYDLAADEQLMQRIETALRRRELLWAERRVVSEQLARARESIQRQLKSWKADEEVTH